MSNKAITWAYGRRTLKSSPKFVLVTLADLADQEHSCFPGVPMLATLTGLSESAVRAQLEHLISQDLVKRERRHRRDGSRTSNRYYLPVDARERAENLASDSDARHSGTKSQNLEGLAPESGVPTASIWGGILEPLVNPQIEPPVKTLMSTPFVMTIEEFFDHFWQWYPRHEGKAPALAKFKIAARKIPPEQLVSHAMAYRDNPNRNQDVKFVPLASTWLHQERWNDEIPEQSAAPPRRLTNTEQALADYAAEYGEPNGRTPVTRALDPGFGDRPAHG